VRRHIGNKLRTHLVGVGNEEDSFDIGEPHLPNAKSIVNDYDYRDWSWMVDPKGDEYIEKRLRK